MKKSARSLLSVILSVFILGLCSVQSASVHAQGVQCEQPNALIILDRSGSMRNDNKWGMAVGAIHDLTLAYDAAVRFGLSYFPSQGDCGVGNSLLQGVAPNNGGAIRGSLLQIGTPQRGALTPIAAALIEGTNYLNNLNDANRQNVIILITDGDQTCDNGGNQVDRARDAFNSGYPVYVISFGQGIRDRGVLTRMAQAGGTGDYFQADDGNQLIQRLIEIIQRTTAEGCDGRDNDCDGFIDERIPPQPCETMCGRGEKLCVDGQLTSCAGGEIPPDECDGIDNDCDNLIDESGYGECTTESGNPGTALCLEGGVIDEDCTPDDPTREEICDGRDNNENGEIDENTDEECAVDCHLGRRRCVEGMLLSCSAPPVGPETCNGYDDDCDGLIDEMAMCVGEEVCGETGECLLPCSNGECFGDFTCDENNICQRRPCPTPCGEGDRCVNQQCITPCIVDSQCGMGEECDSGTRQCVPDGTASPELMMSMPEMGGEVSGGESLGGAEGGGMSSGGEATGDFFVGIDREETSNTDPQATGSNCEVSSPHSHTPLFLLLFVLSCLIASRRRDALRGEA